MRRRQFLTNTMALSSALWLRSWETLEEMPLSFAVPAAFSLRIMATNWGFSGNWDQFCAKAKASGYDGVEVWAPGEARDRDAFLEAANKHQLAFGFLVSGNSLKYEEHLPQFERNLRAAAAMKPVYINCHSGKDYYTLEQGQTLIEAGIRVSKDTGVPIYHETHRGRLLYAATVAQTYMERLPGLRLTLDISHWCCVHESLLQDQEETVAMALSRTDHIHTRVGHPEGPQVSDPRAPEWENALKAHLAWWDKVVEMKVKNGQALTMLTEFGPADYMPTLPFTRQPVADQWGINVHMMQLLRARYGKG